MNKLIEQIDKVINKKGSLKTPAYYIRGLFIDIVNYFEKKVDSLKNDITQINKSNTSKYKTLLEYNNAMYLLNTSNNIVSLFYDIGRLIKFYNASENIIIKDNDGYHIVKDKFSEYYANITTEVIYCFNNNIYLENLLNNCSNEFFKIKFYKFKNKVDYINDASFNYLSIIESLCNITIRSSFNSISAIMLKGNFNDIIESFKNATYGDPSHIITDVNIEYIYSSFKYPINRTLILNDIIVNINDDDVNAGINSKIEYYGNKLVIKEGIKQICDAAFYNMVCEYIILPNSLKYLPLTLSRNAHIVINKSFIINSVFDDRISDGVNNKYITYDYNIINDFVIKNIFSGGRYYSYFDIYNNLGNHINRFDINHQGNNYLFHNKISTKFNIKCKEFTVDVECMELTLCFTSITNKIILAGCYNITLIIDSEESPAFEYFPNLTYINNTLIIPEDATGYDKHKPVFDGCNFTITRVSNIKDYL